MSLLTDYLRHAPCMRQVQSGYERCASEYQQRIKSLNSGAGGNKSRTFISNVLMKTDIIMYV